MEPYDLEAYATVSCIRNNSLLSWVVTVHVALRVWQPHIIAEHVSLVLPVHGQALVILNKRYASIIIVIHLYCSYCDNDWCFYQIDSWEQYIFFKTFYWMQCTLTSPSYRKVDHQLEKAIPATTRTVRRRFLLDVAASIAIEAVEAAGNDEDNLFCKQRAERRLWLGHSPVSLNFT